MFGAWGVGTWGDPLWTQLTPFGIWSNSTWGAAKWNTTPQQISAIQLKAKSVTRAKISKSAIGGGLKGGNGQPISVDWVPFETPAGALDGVNASFRLCRPVWAPLPNQSEYVHIFIDGVLQSPLSYTRQGRDITFLTPPSGTWISASYFRG